MTRDRVDICTPQFSDASDVVSVVFSKSRAFPIFTLDPSYRDYPLLCNRKKDNEGPSIIQPVLVYERNRMPSFFNFQQGTESHGSASDSTPLLGRYRAVPGAEGTRRRSRGNSLFENLNRGSIYGWGYEAVFGDTDGASDGGDLADHEDMGRLRRWRRTQRDLWLEPKQAAVARLIERWPSRWAVLVFLPAILVRRYCTSASLPCADQDAGCDLVCYSHTSVSTPRRRRYG